MKNPLFLSLLLIPASLQAWECEHSKDISQTLDLSKSEKLIVKAAAGDLEVRGVADSDTAVIRGKVCASEEEWLAESTVETSNGTTAEIIVALPDTGSSWSVMGQKYVYLDLELDVPNGLPLEVSDSSGDVVIYGVGELSIRDSSGDINIEDSSGPLSVSDSSGDIEIADIEQDVTIESDSSGNIRGRDIGGTVRVVSDSSGDISFRDVGKDFIVERDSSGDISANRVRGDFKVMRDGSGDIDARNVDGVVETPDDRF
jgi:DUF4097 and DUF4098 domain-containing protein YvlB